MISENIHWRLRVLAVIVAAGCLLAAWLSIFKAPQGDFPRHWEFGRRLAAGEFIYTGGLNYVYPPFWSLAHAPLTVVDPRVAQLLVFPLAPIAIGLLFWVLNRLTRDWSPLTGWRRFWLIAASLAASSQFVLRDLPEVGVNTALLALTWLAVWCWSRGKDWLGGGILGFAIALKCTPLLFVAYFGLKRQWKFCLASILATVAFTLSPMWIQGEDDYAYAMKFWVSILQSGVQEPDPSRSVLGEDKLENLSLRPALARYLMHLPPGHLGRPESSDDPTRPTRPPSANYVQFLNFEPETAGRLVKGVILLMGVVVAGLFLAKPSSRTDPRIVWECAAVSLLILLISPVTWKQHCVGVIPALYLLGRHALSGGRLPRWVVACVVTYILFDVVANRGLLGAQGIKWFDSFHLKTVGLFALTIAVITRRFWKPCR